MAYATATAELTALQGGADSPTVTDALEAGAHDIDAAFAVAGYVTPLDLASISDVDAKTRLTAKLKVVNIGLAAAFLSTKAVANRGRSERAEVHYREAQEFLELVRSGRLRFASLPRTQPAGLAVAGDEEWPAMADYFDTESLIYG